MSTFDETNVRRQPAGVTGAGQFATKPKSESATRLDVGAARRYTTRNDAIQHEIVAAIESGGTDVASAQEFDIEQIANDVLDVDDRGRYHVAVDVDDFWKSVERHARES